MYATDETPRRISKRGDGNEKIAGKPFFVDLCRMFLTVLEQS